jgi:hypothetical protein
MKTLPNKAPLRTPSSGTSQVLSVRSASADQKMSLEKTLLVSSVGPQKSIADEFARVERQNRGLTGSTYFSNPNKDDREWHILGAAQAVCARAQRSFPPFAQKREHPDFALYDDSGAFQHDLEIVTLYPPNYRVHLHHRQSEAQSNKPIYYQSPSYRDHWQWLRESINGKLNLPYIKGCALLVLFSVVLMETIEDQPEDFGLSVSNEWRRYRDGQFGIPAMRSSGVRSIFLLSADVRSLVEIYPTLEVIGK